MRMAVKGMVFETKVIRAMAIRAMVDRTMMIT